MISHERETISAFSHDHSGLCLVRPNPTEFMAIPRLNASILNLSPLEPSEPHVE
jgi:hypothetical protein